jgi:hypothetical protein
MVEVTSRLALLPFWEANILVATNKSDRNIACGKRHRGRTITGKAESERENPAWKQRAPCCTRKPEVQNVAPVLIAGEWR